MAESSSNVVPSKIISVGVVAVVERKAQKPRYAFDIVAEWSDGDRSSCQRSYQEFFTFHCQLLDLFPQEAGTTKGSTRVIPFLPGKKIFRRSTKNLANERLPQLDQYLKQLIQAIPESTIINKFINSNYSEDSLQMSNGDTLSDDTKEEVGLTKSLEAVKILDNSGVVAYSPNIRSNPAATKKTPDTTDQHLQIEENSQAMLQNDTESPLEPHSGENDDAEHNEETKSSSDEEIEHGSIVVQDTAGTQLSVETGNDAVTSIDEEVETLPMQQSTLEDQDSNKVSATSLDQGEEEAVTVINESNETLSGDDETVVATSQDPTPDIDKEKQMDEATEMENEELPNSE